MLIQNMTSANGNDVPNQFIITDHNISVFQSYRTIIAVKANGVVYLNAHMWDHSVTTGKYRNQFLGETIAETRKKIYHLEYKLVTNIHDIFTFELDTSRMNIVD